MDSAKPHYFGCGSVEISSPSSPDETGIRRLAITSASLVNRPLTGINTLPDAIEHGVKTYSNANAMGWRIESEYQYITYLEVQESIEQIARGLLSLGISTDDVVNVYARTSTNWQLFAQACALISTPIATAYDSLGPDGLAHSLREPNCIAVFTNNHLLSKVINVIGSTPSLKHIIYDGELDPSFVAELPGIQLLSLSSIRSLGTNNIPLSPRRPTPSTLACIMYTSGSTGAPKGVCLSHANLIASLGSVTTIFGHHFTPGNVYLAYLPLAHVLEFMTEICALFMGVTIGYGSPRTLKDDLKALRPTIMFGVPSVWETIRKGIVANVQSGGAVKRVMFETAMGWKKSQTPVLSTLADSVVLKRVREATGGRLRVLMNGGAAISRETRDFLSVAVVEMLQGYGMTESCGMCALQPPEFFYPTLHGDGIVAGLPVPSIEIKLVSVPSLGYLASNSCGEILIRGPSVTTGYFNRPDLNSSSEVFTPDGWFRTGDIGKWTPEGCLAVIDRVKNLVKLDHGEYVALERLEAVYKSSRFVVNVCLDVWENDPEGKKVLVGVVFPNEAYLREVFTTEGRSFKEICIDEQVQESVLQSLHQIAKENKLSRHEYPGKVVLTDEEWTVENGLLTAAQKIRRGEVRKKFGPESK